MDNVMQFLFNTNHEQPSILVWVLLIVIAVVIPNYVRYRMEQKRSNDSVPTPVSYTHLTLPTKA